MSGNRSKLAFFDGGWVTLSADSKDGRTDTQTDGQNYDSQDRRRIDSRGN